MANLKTQRIPSWIWLVMVFSTVAGFLTLPNAVLQGQEKRPDSTTWFDSLPNKVRYSVLWQADHEEGSLYDWEFDRNPDNNGGGIFNTGSKKEAIARASNNKPFTGSYCVEATIHNAYLSQMGKKAVRLMRWTDKPWDQGGKFFPKSAYYGVWMRLDRNYSARNSAGSTGGWWNVFQFKSHDNDGDSQPVWTLNIGNQAPGGQMNFYLYSKQNPPNSFAAKPIKPIPVGRWFHVEAFYQQSTEGQGDGNISIWQDGELILKANNVKTVLLEDVIWGIGNYTDHIVGGKKNGSATIYFDDATVSTSATHPHAAEFSKQRSRLTTK